MLFWKWFCCVESRTIRGKCSQVVLSRIVEINWNSVSRESANFYSVLSRENRPFARWRHFTTMTRILFVFLFIFKVGSPSEV